MSVDELDAIDARLSADPELYAVAEDLAPPGADVTTYEDDGTLTTAVITPLLDDDDDEPPRLHGAAPADRTGVASSALGRAPAAPQKATRKPTPPPQKRKKKKEGKKRGAVSKKEKARNRAPQQGAPKSNLVKRSGGMKGRTR